MEPMQNSLDDLIELLNLDNTEGDVFRGHSPEELRQRVFGGQVASQALLAAGSTVPSDRMVHSLHSYFLRPGQSGTPIFYEVDRLRDGRSFTTRRVVAVQNGRPIFNLSASFQLSQSGPSHQDPMPQVPGPQGLPSMDDLLRPLMANPEEVSRDLLEWASRPRPIAQRFVDLPSWSTRGEKAPALQRVWIKADGTLPDNPLLHACIVAYASDLSLLDSVLLPHGLSWGDSDVSGASLDHAMWFHAPFRADEWLLYDQASPAAGGARGLATGGIYTHEGVRAVTVVQEGLLRVGHRPNS